MTRTASSVWNNCLLFIKDNIKPQAYKTWFEPIKPMKIAGDVLTIQVPSKFFFEWLEEHYVDLLKRTIRKEVGSEAKLEYSIVMENNSGNKNPYTIKIPTTDSNVLKNPQVSMPVDIGNKTIRNPFVIPGLRKVNVDSNLNPNYSFENFIEGDCNRLARSAGFAVAEKPGGTAFNPLLIYGGVGLGKTHLAHAIGVEIKEKYQSLEMYIFNELGFNENDIKKLKKLYSN